MHQLLPVSHKLAERAYVKDQRVEVTGDVEVGLSNDPCEFVYHTRIYDGDVIRYRRPLPDDRDGITWALILVTRLPAGGLLPPVDLWGHVPVTLLRPYTG